MSGGKEVADDRKMITAPVYEVHTGSAVRRGLLLRDLSAVTQSSRISGEEKLVRYVQITQVHHYHLPQQKKISDHPKQDDHTGLRV